MSGDHRRRQNVYISDTLSCGSCATFLFLPHFDAIYNVLLNRRTAIWNLFVKYTAFSLTWPASDYVLVIVKYMYTSQKAKHDVKFVLKLSKGDKN